MMGFPRAAAYTAGVSDVDRSRGALSDAQRSALAAVGARHGLEVLALHGSRALGTARVDSDWDFAYAATGNAAVDKLALVADLGAAVGSDDVDVADLERAGGLLRFRAARDGVLLHEGSPGAWRAFRLAAISFWCDAEPVLRRAYAARLARF